MDRATNRGNKPLRPYVAPTTHPEMEQFLVEWLEEYEERKNRSQETSARREREAAWALEVQEEFKAKMSQLLDAMTKNEKYPQSFDLEFVFGSTDEGQIKASCLQGIPGVAVQLYPSGTSGSIKATINIGNMKGALDSC